MPQTLDALLDQAPDHVINHFTCDCAERALGRLSNPDPRSVEALRVRREWIEGRATDQEMAAARSVAWSVAWSVPGSAARVGASAAGREWQIAHLRSLINEYQVARRSLISLLERCAAQTAEEASRWHDAWEHGLFD